MPLKIATIIQAGKNTLAEVIDLQTQKGDAPSWKPIPEKDISAGYIKSHAYLLAIGLIREVQDKYEIDIAHVKNSYLPASRSAGNYLAAESAMKAVLHAIEQGKDLSTQETINEISEAIHTAWLDSIKDKTTDELPKWVIETKQNMPVASLPSEKQSFYNVISTAAINIVTSLSRKDF